MEKADYSFVRARAGYRCEYCHFPEAIAELPFQLDHIIAQQHGGEGRDGQPSARVLLLQPLQGAEPLWY